MAKVTENKDEKTNKPKMLHQYLSAFAVNMGVLGISCAVGYSSPASVLMRDPKKTDLLLTDTQFGWFSSILNIGAIFGSLFGGFFLRRFGRKYTLLFSAIPTLIGWLLIGIAQHFYVLIAGRLLLGAMLGFISLASPAYMGEIASPQIRGKLGSCFFTMITLGTTYTYILGAYVKDFRLLCIPCAAPTVLFAILMIFNYESPVYYLSVNKEKEAKEVFRKLRGASYDMSVEWDSLKRLSDKANKSGGFSWLKFLNAEVYKPFIILLCLFFIVMFSGAITFLFNLNAIFQSSQSTISNDLSSVIFSFSRIPASLLGFFLMDVAGRKLLVTVSTIGMAISLVIFGAYFEFLERDEIWTVTTLWWLPLASTIAYICMYTIGLALVPWVYIGEVFTPDVKEVTSSIITAYSWTLSFLVTFTYAPLKNILSDAGIYWFYASVCFAGAIFSIFFLTETKGKTLEEIVNLYKGKSGKIDKENKRVIDANIEYVTRL